MGNGESFSYMEDPRIILAPNGTFITLQGEGPLTGERSLFIRLAGCPVACEYCDTDYTKGESISLSELERALFSHGNMPKAVVITGGEPLLETRKRHGVIVALCAMFRRRNMTITAETSLTLSSYDWAKDYTRVADYFSIAPKVPEIGLKPKMMTNPTTLFSFIRCNKGWIKFVVCARTKDSILADLREYAHYYRTSLELGWPTYAVARNDGAQKHDEAVLLKEYKTLAKVVRDQTIIPGLRLGMQAHHLMELP